MSRQSHSFSVEYAELYGIECAILINHFQFWIEQNQAMGRNFHDGRTWMYQTQNEIASIYPYWNRDKVQAIIQKLVDLKIIIKGNYNKTNFDKTTWYAFENEKIFTKVRNRTIDGSDPHNQLGTSAQPIPDTKTDTKKIYEVNDGASPSLTPSKKKGKSLFKGKDQFDPDKLACFEWLKTLGIDTTEDTLSWWAKNYTMERLEEVYKEVTQRKPKSIGAYMHKLLKSQATVTTGRIEVNREYAEIFRDLKGWRALEIMQKYANIDKGNHNIEIDFNMDIEEFRNYLHEKYESHGCQDR